MKVVKLVVFLYLILVMVACQNKTNKNNKNDANIENKTNKNANKSLTGLNLDKKLKPAENAVKEILITSPRYIELTKDLQQKIDKAGGLYFGIYLQKSPQNNNDGRYSNTYEFTLYEVYPERQVNTARFSFNPVNKQLSEYDLVNDTLIPIIYDSSLLLSCRELNN